MDLISNSGVNPKKKLARVWVLHKYYPFVTIVMHNV